MQPLLFGVLVGAAVAPAVDPLLLLVVPDLAVLLAVRDALFARKLLPLGKRLAALLGQGLLTRLAYTVGWHDRRERRKRAVLGMHRVRKREHNIEQRLRCVSRRCAQVAVPLLGRCQLGRVRHARVHCR